jgi:hypothetical protein
MERWVQTCQRELLDRTLIWNQSHLLHSLREFEQFYNGHRPHQGIANARPLQPLPVPLVSPGQIASLDIRRHDRLGGVLHEYQHRHELHGWGFRQGQAHTAQRPAIHADRRWWTWMYETRNETARWI